MNAFVILIMILGVTGYVTYPLWGKPDGTRKRQPRAVAAASTDIDADEQELDRAAGRLSGDDLAGMRSEAPAAATADEADEIERRVKALRAKRGRTREATSPEKRNNRG